jgi:acyl-CoA dehydrogenase
VNQARVDPELERLFANVFNDWRSARERESSRAVLDRKLWRTLEGLGLDRLTSAAGAGWEEAAALLRAAARTAAPVPIAENDLLAHWLLAQAGIPGQEGIWTVATFNEAGLADRVPWAEAVDGVVALRRRSQEWIVVATASTLCSITVGWDLAGQPRDAVRIPDLDAMAGIVVPAAVVAQYRLRGALARSVQMTGAMDHVVDLCVQFASERKQFGRPIARFQAVQQLIADAACESFLARAATDIAVAAMASTTAADEERELKVAMAKSVAGHAASVVVRNAHQVHGAIGTTFEHPLHEFTIPILAWRNEFGSVRAWDARLTDLLVSSGTSAWSFGVPLEDSGPTIQIERCP